MVPKRNIDFTDEQFREFFELAPIGKAITGADGILIKVNRHLADMLHYEPEELVGVSFADITHPDDMEISKECVMQLVSGAQDTWSLDKRYLIRDGGHVWTHITTRMLRDNQKNPQYFLTQILDISDRKVMELQLQEMQTILEKQIDSLETAQLEISALYAQTPLIMFLVDETDNVYRLNKMAIELFDDVEERLIGKPIGAALRCIHAAQKNMSCADESACDSCVLRKLSMDTRNSGTSHFQQEGLLRVLNNQGEETDLIVLISTSRISDHIDKKILVCLQDVTLERQMQASLVQSDRLASMGMLAAGVAHEINNPLIYILYHLESLAFELPNLAEGMRRCLEAFVRHAGADTVHQVLGRWRDIYNPNEINELANKAQNALKGVEQIKETARGLGTFSRVEKDDIWEVDVNDSVETAINLAYNEIKYRARLVKELNQTPDVFASDGRLAQVVLNLLINAAHAVEEGHAKDNVIRVRTYSDNKTVFISISDTGYGISPDELPRLFDPFFTTKTKGKGTGLGLFISKNIIHGFGGELHVTSKPGKGSIFTISLPIRSEDLLLTDQNIDSSVLAHEKAGRVLVVDDDALARETICRMLKKYHNVIAAESGASGKQTLETDRHFDAVICDVIMPDMTGIDLYTWLESVDSQLAQRMIFVTGGAFTKKSRAFLSDVDNPVLDKPFNTQLVLETVQKIMAGHITDSKDFTSRDV